MSMFSRILVGTDGSQAADHAVDFAAKLALEHRSGLIVCNFVNWITPMSEAAAAGALTSPDMIDQLRAAGDEILVLAKQRAKAAGVVAQSRLLDGEPASGILGLADEEACTLIVVATHGRSGFEHFFLGSTTEAVLRGSTIPVLTVRDGDRPMRSGRSFEHILVAIDDSEPSDAALATVVEFPFADRRRVQLVGVSVDELREETERVVDAAREAARRRGCTCEGLVVEGRPAATLVATAEHEKADLIVLGSHGRRGLRRLFIGSVAESVVESSPIPVLVVRSLQTASVPVREPLRGFAPVGA